MNAGHEELALEYLAKIWTRNGRKDEYLVCIGITVLWCECSGYKYLCCEKKTFDKPCRHHVFFRDVST